MLVCIVLARAQDVAVGVAVLSASGKANGRGGLGLLRPIPLIFTEVNGAIQLREELEAVDDVGTHRAFGAVGITGQYRVDDQAMILNRRA